MHDLFIQSNSDIYHGEIAHSYLNRRGSLTKWAKEQSLMEELLAREPNNCRVLDVPFGTGRFVEMYVRKNMDICGVEISKDMVAAAEKALGPTMFNRCKVEIASADAIPFEDSSFDLVVCCRFLGMTSLDLASRVLTELNRVCRNRLILYMAVRKQHSSAIAFADRFLQWLGRAPAYHRRLGSNISEVELVALLRAHGFDAVDSRVIHDGKDNMYLYYILTKCALN
jgi:ubiquinone/menaquinone biosynthesis C-methylase UbiE